MGSDYPTTEWVLKMKKYIWLVGFLFFSCTSARLVTEVASSQYLYAYDFTPYTEKGFLFTPYRYEGDYESVASISFLYYPKYVLYAVTDSTIGIGGSTSTPVVAGSKPAFSAYATYKWETAEVTLEKALEGVYVKCVTLGADALTDFVLQEVAADYSPLLTPPLTRSGLKITGYAIRRKGAFK